MTYSSLSSRWRLLFTALLTLSLTACGGDDDSVKDSDDPTGESVAGETPAGETPAGETSAGEAPAGEDTAGEVTAGETSAGEDTAGETPAGEDSAGETPAGETPAGETPAGETPPVEEFVCSQDVLQIQRGRITPTPNLSYIGVDDRFNFTNIIQIEFLNQPAIGEIVSFEGVTPQTCEDVCIYIGVQCEEEGCAEVYFASQGSLTLTAGGTSGEEVSFEINGLVLSELNRETGDLNANSTSCLSDQEISALQPTLVDDPIPQTFALQNCETGEIVNVQEFGAEAKGIWYFATAGWCPACRQTLTYLYAEVFPTFTPESIRPMIVVSEDDQYRPATLAFCKTYGMRYAPDASDFYLDASLDTTFSNVWPYLNDDGSFGLPWQAVFEGGTGTYLYGDGGPGVDTLDDVLNRLLAE